MKTLRSILFLAAILALTGISQANLITNGDFEGGTANWPELGAWGNANLTFENGELYMDTNAENLTDTENYGAYARSDRFAVSDGLVIDYSIDYATWISTTPQESGYLFRIQLYDDADEWAGDILLEEITDHTGFGWNTLTGQVTINNADAVKAAVELSNGVYNDFNGAVKVDNVSVVPEPATLSLLGLGAVALMRKKRSA